MSQGTELVAGSPEPLNGGEQAAGASVRIPVTSLKNGVRWPLWVDPTRREVYLSPEDFAVVFGISREEYGALPDWKQLRMKVEAGLF